MQANFSTYCSFRSLHPSTSSHLRRHRRDPTLHRLPHARRHHVLLRQTPPRLHRPLRHLPHDPLQRQRRHPRRRRKPAHLLRRQPIQLPAPPERQRQLVPRYVRKRRQQIVCRRQHRPPPVRIQQRPVLQVHVPVPDQHRKRQPPHELRHPRVARLRRQHRRQVRVAPMPVLVLRKQPEHL